METFDEVKGLQIERANFAHLQLAIRRFNNLLCRVHVWRPYDLLFVRGPVFRVTMNAQYLRLIKISLNHKMNTRYILEGKSKVPETIDSSYLKFNVNSKIRFTMAKWRNFDCPERVLLRARNGGQCNRIARPKSDATI